MANTATTIEQYLRKDIANAMAKMTVDELGVVLMQVKTVQAARKASKAAAKPVVVEDTSDFVECPSCEGTGEWKGISKVTGLPVEGRPCFACKRTPGKVPAEKAATMLQKMLA